MVKPLQNKLIKKKLNYNSKVHIIDVDYTASEYRGLFATCDMLVAERMHAAISGLSCGVCTVAVGYSVKAEGIMSDFFKPELLHKGLLISIEDFLKPNLACKKIRNLWQRRHEISERIKNVLPEIKKRASSNFNMILEALE